MNQSPILSLYWEQALKSKSIIGFHPSPKDSTHFVVSRLTEEGSATIGHVYVEIDGDDFRYISTNSKGKQIFQPTTDFNSIEIQFERYARLIAIQQKTKNLNQNKILTYNLNLKNPNTMKNPTQNKEQKPQRLNQFRFVEYEKPTKEGHYITVVDSYNNPIGRVHKSYNEETKKYEYVAFDHAGNLMYKRDKEWEIKKDFVLNRDQLLEQAHQRRIASKEKSKELQNEKSVKAQPDKATERKNEMKNLREGKSSVERSISQTAEDARDETKSADKENDQENESLSQEDEREQKLDDIRNDRDDDDRGDMDLDR